MQEKQFVHRVQLAALLLCLDYLNVSDVLLVSILMLKAWFLVFLARQVLTPTCKVHPCALDVN